MSSGPEKLMPPPDLMACAVCLRYFAPDRLSTHEAICSKSSAIKRKSFDISQQRIRGTEAERLGKSTSNNECLPSEQKSGTCGLVTNWREKHEGFLRKIKELKERANERNKKFVLKRKVLKLYKDFLSVTKLVPSKTGRKEIQDWIRMEFKSRQNEKDEDAIKLHLHQGERSLKELEKTIHLSK